MTRTGVVIVAALAALLVPPAAWAAGPIGAGVTGAAKALALGEKAPAADIRMKNVDGRELTIAEARGPHGTLVLFTCNHCPYVKAWQKRIAELGNTYSSKGIGVIAINPNDPGQYPEDDYPGMQQRAKELSLAYPYVVDATSAVARAFGATRTPEAFLFDKNGTLVYHGTIDDNAEQPDRVQKHFLRDALEAVTADRAPEVQETKALGCGIKLRSS